MIYEPFIHHASFIHDTDPRYRIVFAFLYTATVALLKEFPTLIASFLFSMTFIFLARLKGREVLRQLLPALGFILLIWMILPFTYPGNPLIRLGPLGIIEGGIFIAAQVTLKSISILLTLMALTATMSIAVLGHAMNRIGLPEKLVYLLLFAYRYIFVIEKEYQRLVRAAKIRGFRPKTNLHTYKTVAYLVGMIFLQAFARAERVHQAMICRGFNGTFYSLWEFSKSRNNTLFILLMTIFLTALVLVELLIR
ncbi:MAG: cobalt ECF transporter T component CbiQ [Pseudomonadota bacterium]